MPLSKQQRLALRQRWYPAAETNALGPVLAALDRTIVPGAAVLDAGTGVGTWILKPYAHRARIVIGADVALPRRQEAPLAQPVAADLAALPFGDAAFDVILCYNVIEHLPDPGRAFREFARLLAPGGALILKTPSVGAPVIWLSRSSPLWLHRRLKGNLAVAEEDVFPTVYRCNSVRRLKDALAAAGLQQESLVTADQTYDYLHFARPGYILGLLYSRAVTGVRWLRSLHSTLVAVYRKPA